MDNNIHCLCKVDVDEETVFQKLPGTSKLNLFRIMQEALVNAAKHADAQEVSVLFRTEKNGAKHVLELSVTDDGIGFDVDSVSKMEILLNHTGILSMKSRAAAMGGTFSIISSDSGTEISVKVPL
jgi:signal transduction histidine kinase